MRRKIKMAVCHIAGGKSIENTSSGGAVAGGGAGEMDTIHCLIRDDSTECLDDLLLYDATRGASSRSEEEEEQDEECRKPWIGDGSEGAGGDIFQEEQWFATTISENIPVPPPSAVEQDSATDDVDRRRGGKTASTASESSLESCDSFASCEAAGEPSDVLFVVEGLDSPDVFEESVCDTPPCNLFRPPLTIGAKCDAIRESAAEIDRCLIEETEICDNEPLRTSAGVNTEESRPRMKESFRDAGFDIDEFAESLDELQARCKGSLEPAGDLVQTIERFEGLNVLAVSTAVGDIAMPSGEPSVATKCTIAAMPVRCNNSSDIVSLPAASHDSDTSLLCRSDVGSAGVVTESEPFIALSSCSQQKSETSDKAVEVVKPESYRPANLVLDGCYDLTLSLTQLNDTTSDVASTEFVSLTPEEIIASTLADNNDKSRSIPCDDANIDISRRYADDSVSSVFRSVRDTFCIHGKNVFIANEASDDYASLGRVRSSNDIVSIDDIDLDMVSLSFLGCGEEELSADSAPDPACDKACDPACGLACDPACNPACNPACDTACNPAFNPSFDPACDPFCEPACDPASDPAAIEQIIAECLDSILDSADARRLRQSEPFVAATTPVSDNEESSEGANAGEDFTFVDVRRSGAVYCDDTTVTSASETGGSCSEETIAIGADVLSTSAGRKKGLHVTFPEDGKLVSSYLGPQVPWKNAESCSVKELTLAYKAACAKLAVKPIQNVLSQLQLIESFHKRHDALSLKGESLNGPQCDALEEVFKRVQFGLLDLEATRLDDETAVVMFDLIEFYEPCLRLNISNNAGIGLRGWTACSRMLKKIPCLEVLETSVCAVPDQAVSFLGRALQANMSLHTLRLEGSIHAGRPLMLLATALRLNKTLRELYLGNNQLLPADATHLGTLLRFNCVLRVLDVRNNHLQDIGLARICDGLCEQQRAIAGQAHQDRSLAGLEHSLPGLDVSSTGRDQSSAGLDRSSAGLDRSSAELDRLSVGLAVLIVWNNQLTHESMPALSRVLASTPSLETLNLGHNALTNEGVHRLKDGLQQNQTLERFGLQSTRLSCEGAIALAEFIAESARLVRIDLRSNGIKTAGLMALTLSLKVSQTVTSVDLDQDVKKDTNMQDYADQQKRLLADIAGYTQRNFSLCLQQQQGQDSSVTAIPVPDPSMPDPSLTPVPDSPCGEVVQQPLKSRDMDLAVTRTCDVSLTLVKMAPLFGSPPSTRAQTLESPAYNPDVPFGSGASPDIVPGVPSPAIDDFSRNDNLKRLESSTATGAKEVPSLSGVAHLLSLFTPPPGLLKESSFKDPSNNAPLLSSELPKDPLSVSSEDFSGVSNAILPLKTTVVAPPLPLAPPVATTANPPKPPAKKSKFMVSKVMTSIAKPKPAIATAVLFTRSADRADDSVDPLEGDTHVCIVGTTTATSGISDGVLPKPPPPPIVNVVKVVSQQGNLDLHPLKKRFSAATDAPGDSDGACGVVGVGTATVAQSENSDSGTESGNLSVVSEVTRALNRLNTGDGNLAENDLIGLDQGISERCETDPVIMCDCGKVAEQSVNSGSKTDLGNVAVVSPVTDELGRLNQADRNLAGNGAMGHGYQGISERCETDSVTLSDCGEVVGLIVSVDAAAAEPLISEADVGQIGFVDSSTVPLATDPVNTLDQHANFQVVDLSTVDLASVDHEIFNLDAAESVKIKADNVVDATRIYATSDSVPITADRGAFEVAGSNCKTVGSISAKKVADEVKPMACSARSDMGLLNTSATLDQSVYPDFVTLTNCFAELNGRDLFLVQSHSSDLCLNATKFVSEADTRTSAESAELIRSLIDSESSESSLADEFSSHVLLGDSQSVDSAVDLVSISTNEDVSLANSAAPSQAVSDSFTACVAAQVTSEIGEHITEPDGAMLLHLLDFSMDVYADELSACEALNESCGIHGVSSTKGDTAVESVTRNACGTSADIALGLGDEVAPMCDNDAVTASTRGSLSEITAKSRADDFFIDAIDSDHTKADVVVVVDRSSEVSSDSSNDSAALTGSAMPGETVDLTPLICTRDTPVLSSFLSHVVCMTDDEMTDGVFSTRAISANLNPNTSLDNVDKDSNRSQVSFKLSPLFEHSECLLKDSELLAQDSKFISEGSKFLPEDSEWSQLRQPLNRKIAEASRCHIEAETLDCREPSISLTSEASIDSQSLMCEHLEHTTSVGERATHDLASFESLISPFENSVG